MQRANGCRAARSSARTPALPYRARWTPSSRDRSDFYHEMKASNVLDKVALVYGQMNEPPGNRLRVALTGLTMAEHFRDEGRDVLFFVDNIYRFTLAGTEV